VTKTCFMKKGDSEAGLKPWARRDWKHLRTPIDAGRTKATSTIFQVKRFLRESGQPSICAKVGECIERMVEADSPN
jgi:hypothetical protein